MKKQIRLLLENIFNDIYDIDQENNSSVEIADEHLTYKFFPTNFHELRSLLKKLLNERGPNANLNDIDISQVTTFYDKASDKGLFENLDPHNIDISNWDVSNVTNMVGTFWLCRNFNCNLNNWNVKKVRYMCNMFNYCEKFDSSLSNWKTSNVINMFNMFHCCKSFKGNGLENWDVKKVTNMQDMFSNCKNFNCDLKNWNVKKVKYMSFMFLNCDSFEGIGLENWEINTNAIAGMLKNCERLTNIPSWYNDDI